MAALKYAFLLLVIRNDVNAARWKSEYCLQPPSYGTCKGRIASWYYDPGIENCKMFYYSGCGENKNRFSSEGWCQWYCLPRNKMRKNVCSRREYGEKCYGRTQRWYFDYKDNICREFKDGYCGLVPNRFDTCEQCIRRCSDSDPNVSCTVPDGKKKW
ncbi:amblin-like isoform X1 [Dermacentor andersoni]|uniref:amblin-like isoform X1 n=1 Tax=Dermacentor andersoni TaxID=34620 RepID=UPI003B3A7BAE